MAINTSKVVTGGLAAGVVANIIGFALFGMLLGARMNAESVAVAPALEGRGMSTTAIAWNVLASFVIGLLLVWLYAAMRPRFGPGAKTAVYAALVVWLCGFLFHMDWLLVGMMTPATTPSPPSPRWSRWWRRRGWERSCIRRATRSAEVASHGSSGVPTAWERTSSLAVGHARDASLPIGRQQRLERTEHRLLHVIAQLGQ